MPLNDFFTYILTESEKERLRARITIDGKHRLFEGHFPGNPVTPGVVLLEIMRQVLCEAAAKDLMLSGARDIKFTNPVIPEQHTEFDLEMNIEEAEGEILVNAVFSEDDIIFTKIRGRYREV